MIKQILTFILYPLVVIAPLWLIGFGVFVLYALSFHFVQDAQADSIVAWTGGDYRIQTAISLLEQGRANKLLISGVNKTVKPDSFLKNISQETRSKIAEALPMYCFTARRNNGIT